MAAEDWIPKDIDDFYRIFGNDEDGHDGRNERDIFLRWQADHPGQGMEQFRQVWNGWYNKFAGKGGGDGTGAGQGPLNISDLQDKTYTGLYGWGNDYIKGLVAKYGTSSMDQYQQAINALNGGGKFIDQQANLQKKQYRRDIQAPLMQAIGGAVGQAAGTGTLGSSMSGDWMARITQQALQGAQQANAQSNIWASGAKYQNLKDRVSAAGGLSGLLGDYLGLSKYSTGTDTNWNGLSF